LRSPVDPKYLPIKDSPLLPLRNPSWVFDLSSVLRTYLRHRRELLIGWLSGFVGRLAVLGKRIKTRYTFMACAQFASCQLPECSVRQLQLPSIYQPSTRTPHLCNRTVWAAQMPAHGNWFMPATWLHFGTGFRDGMGLQHLLSSFLLLN